MAIPASRKFAARVSRLQKKVGDGDLTGHVVVDQRYAKYQHESLDLRHPNGGQAKYLWEPLFSSRNEMVRRLARNVLRGNLNQAMVQNVEDVASDVFDHAPVELADLRRSAEPSVRDEGQLTYFRPATRRRLTDAELAAKSRLRTYLGLNLGYDPRNPNP